MLVTNHTTPPLLSRMLIIAFALVFLGLLPQVAHAQSRSRGNEFTKEVTKQADKILASIHYQDDREEALEQGYLLADYVSAHAGIRQLDAVVKAEALIGLLELFSAVETDAMVDAAWHFVRSPLFMIELGLLVDEKDDAAEVVRLATAFMTYRNLEVELYPELAAAICVVHDLPQGTRYSTRVNENRPTGPDPLELFDFYMFNAGSMTFAPHRLPAIDLVYVVDVSESIEQLQWAHDTYGRSPDIGRRFFEIKYDYAHYRTGTPKRVTQAGNYSLTQIKKYGGVCADQAYFAMSVAKACGIPSGYVRAKGADVSHAWVGYLEAKGNKAQWNFDAGRYPEYQRLRGNLSDPQTGDLVSDGRVGILGTATNTRKELVLQSMAAARVVSRMNANNWDPPKSMALDSKGNLRKPRSDSTSDRLALLKTTLSKCAGVPKSWDAVTEIASAGDMKQAELDVWAKAVMRLAGDAHQDFSFDFLVDLISTIEKPKKQHAMWEWAFAQFGSRPDLAAAVRFEQGRLWEEHGKPDMAWTAYQDVIDKFLNDGPMSDRAISAMGKLLSKNGKRDAYLDLLQRTATKVNRPEKMATQFAKQSNYYKIHWRLVKELEYHHRDDEAQTIRALIHMPDDD